MGNNYKCLLYDNYRKRIVFYARLVLLSSNIVSSSVHATTFSTHEDSNIRKFRYRAISFQRGSPGLDRLHDETGLEEAKLPPLPRAFLLPVPGVPATSKIKLARAQQLLLVALENLQPPHHLRATPQSRAPRRVRRAVTDFVARAAHPPAIPRENRFHHVIEEFRVVLPLVDVDLLEEPILRGFVVAAHPLPLLLLLLFFFLLGLREGAPPGTGSKYSPLLLLLLFLLFLQQPRFQAAGESGALL